MTVHAPFRFAPINEEVYFPPWGPLASHDIPFKDGLCGEISLEIEAKTPLLVAGLRRKATANKEGEARAFQLPDKTYALPSSSLQGMVRSVLEIASCSKLGAFVDERRFGIRDLDEAAAPFYRKRLVNYWKTGFMTRTFARDANGQTVARWQIAPCDHRRICFADIPLKMEWTRSELPKANNSVKRYGFIRSVGPYNAVDKTRFDVTLQPDPEGSAWLVMTGNTGAQGMTQKAREFVFVDNGGAQIPVPDDVCTDFKHIHENGEPDDPRQWADNWRAFWENGYGNVGTQEPFKDGGRIPVFYIVEDNKVASIGLASMFKLAHKLTTHQMLAASSPEHLRGARSKSVVLDGKDQLDLASLIFGAASGDKDRLGLRRRASFDIARAVVDKNQPLKIETFERAILLSPKPSYYPIYVVQPFGHERDNLPIWQKVIDGKTRGASAPYATYTPLQGTIETYKEAATSAHQHPRLAGVKIWPARGDGWQNAKLRPNHLETKKSLQTTLKALDVGTTFRTTLRFHNLRAVELGALLWALTLAEPAAWSKEETIELRHRLGMGKPFGLGEIAIRIVGDASILRNDRESVKASTVPDLIAEYEKEMTTFKPNWRSSHGVQTLLAAADPRIGRKENVTTTEQDERTCNAFDYMEIKTGTGGWNDFAAAKREGRFLPPYVAAPVFELVRRARVMVAGRFPGTIIAILPDNRYRVQPDNGGKPQPYSAALLAPLTPGVVR